jgi:hypothetical protein
MSVRKKRLDAPQPYDGDPKVDALVGDTQFIQEIDISNNTKCRWDLDPEMHALGWPVPVKIKDRNYRSRHAIEAFKANMLKHAIEKRRQLVEKLSRKGGAEAAAG